jgi:RimJ/RimL family protein N-acetyltransferase
LGEVGLRNIDHERRRAEVSWWLAPEHRGRGVAAAAARLLTDWALSPAGGLDQVWARIDPANVASARVAAAAGLAGLGSAGGTAVWSRTREATSSRSARPT